MAENSKHQTVDGQSKELPVHTEFYGRHNCDNCTRDMPNLRIQCAECRDFDLCLGCFSLGAELGNHLNSHPYQIVRKGGLDPFDNTASLISETPHIGSERRKSSVSKYHDSKNKNKSNSKAILNCELTWSAVEHTRLLDAVEHHGIGNWSRISAYVETRSANECKRTYSKFYIDGGMGKYTTNMLAFSGVAIDHANSTIIDPSQNTPSFSICPYNPVSVSGMEASLLGYADHRDDYDDYETLDGELRCNTVSCQEKMVSQIEDQVDEDDLDIDIKLLQCDNYQRVLRENSRRNQLVRDQQLHELFYVKNPKLHIGTQVNLYQNFLYDDSPFLSGLNKYEQTLKHVLARSCTEQNYHQFLKNHMHMEHLKTRIRKLRKYRKNGLRKTDEIVKFESARIKRHIKSKTNGIVMKASKISTVPKKTIEHISEEFSSKSPKYTLSSFLSHISPSTSITSVNNESPQICDSGVQIARVGQTKTTPRTTVGYSSKSPKNTLPSFRLHISPSTSITSVNKDNPLQLCDANLQFTPLSNGKASLEETFEMLLNETCLNASYGSSKFQTEPLKEESKLIGQKDKEIVQFRKLERRKTSATPILNNNRKPNVPTLKRRTRSDISKTDSQNERVLRKK